MNSPENFYRKKVALPGPLEQHIHCQMAKAAWGAVIAPRQPTSGMAKKGAENPPLSST
jgi:hypothetical protein